MEVEGGTWTACCGDKGYRGVREGLGRVAVVGSEQGDGEG